MVVTIQEAALKYRNSGYRVSKMDNGLLIEHTASSPEAGYKGNTKRTYKSRLVSMYRALMAKNAKKPSPKDVEARSKRSAIFLRKYLHAPGENRVKGWGEYALSNKHVPIVINEKDHGIGTGFGPLKEGGKVYYTTFMAPAGEKVSRGPIKVMDYLNIAAEFGEKVYKSVTGKLSKHSKLWAKLLRHVKVGEKSEARIIKFPGREGIENGSLARELYRQTG